MSALAIIGVAFLATLVGFAFGVRYTSRRYQRLLNAVGDDIDKIFGRYIGPLPPS